VPQRAAGLGERTVMVKSANRTLEVIETIGWRGSLTQSDIIKLLGIPKSSASALLSTLTRSGYLQLDARTRLYSLGPQFVTLAGRYLSKLDIVRISQPILRDLTNRIDESSFLLCRSDDAAIVMWREFCTQPLAYNMQLGERAPMALTAGGIAILAYIARDQWPDTRLSEAPVNPITPEYLDRQVANVRAGGSALTKGVMVAGDVSLGRPVFDHEHRVNAAITVTIPTIRYKPQNLREIDYQLATAANQISEQLGYHAAKPRHALRNDPVS